MNRLILLAFATLCIAGCSSTYQHADTVSPSGKLDPSRGVLVAVPEDGRFEGDTYPNSGQMTADAIRTAFAANAVRADIATHCRGQACLSGIDTAKYGYLVTPSIQHWEERATEWSGKPDRITIQVVVFDTASGKQVSNSTYSGKSKWASFGGDHPQDLLPEPTTAYVTGLYK